VALSSSTTELKIQFSLPQSFILISLNFSHVNWLSFHIIVPCNNYPSNYSQSCPIGLIPTVNWTRFGHWGISIWSYLSPDFKELACAQYYTFFFNLWAHLISLIIYNSRPINQDIGVFYNIAIYVGQNQWEKKLNMLSYRQGELQENM
jgi:hypothetical protein